MEDRLTVAVKSSAKRSGEYETVVYEIQISNAAQTELEEILESILRRFSGNGRNQYMDLFVAALGHLLADAKRSGIRRRDDVLLGVYAYHQPNSRKRKGKSANTESSVGKPRHFVFFSVKGEHIQVFHFLHDCVDFARQVLTGNFSK